MSTLLSVLGFKSPGEGFKKSGARGFTLVELLVVIAIISILATLLLLQLGIARAKARDAKRIADINQVRTALELWFDDNGSYRATNDMAALKPSYLINIPHDPIVAGCTDTYAGTIVGALNCYGYEWKPLANPSSFQVWAELEQKNTNALTNDTDITSIGWAGTGAEVTGATEACSNTVATDCVYDAGQP